MSILIVKIVEELIYLKQYIFFKIIAVTQDSLKPKMKFLNKFFIVKKGPFCFDVSYYNTLFIHL